MIYIIDELKLIDVTLETALRSLRSEPSPDKLREVLQLPQFEVIVEQILDFEKGSDGELTVNYLKDVSLLLSLVSAVRECNIEQHIQAERNMIYLAFAYDHHNYARYNTYQNVYLSYLKQIDHPAFHDLKSKGIGGSITGDKFSAIHGDLFTELFNKETKGTAGPFRSGFSTDIDAVNCWVNTIHIHTLLRKELHKCLHIKTSSKHKEITPRGIKTHVDHVKSLKQKLYGYGIDPFSNECPRHMPTGKIIEAAIVSDMLRAPELGMSQYKAFIADRLIKGKVTFYAPIKKNNLKTGIKKIKKSRKAEDVLKEDCQAFGTIIAKALTIEEAFHYPITSIPLSIATLEGDLRQSEKASFRNFLINNSNAATNSIPKRATWLIDGLAAIQSLKSKETYGEWIESLLRFITPPEIAECLLIGMVNDTYQELSTKNNTRKKRGEDHIRTVLEGFEQHMPTGIKWNEFLRNAKNKEELINIIVRFVKSCRGQQLIGPSFIVTAGDKVYRFQEGQERITECNHEEADTQMILFAYQETSDIVVVAKDTDVLILLIWAYSHFDIKYDWFLKYDAEKYANIRTICEYLGKDVCESIIAFHAITGSDTTSYFSYWKSKDI